MSAFIALGHIVGALATLAGLSLGLTLLAGWESKRRITTALEEMSLSLGIPLAALDHAETEVIRFQAARFSSELLCNRLSDLCGWVRTGWDWFGVLLQAGALLGAVWYTVTVDLSNSVHAWWIVVIALFFWISSAAFSLICRLLTGRFPGQARQARKMLGEIAHG